MLFQKRRHKRRDRNSTRPSALCGFTELQAAIDRHQGGPDDNLRPLAKGQGTGSKACNLRPPEAGGAREHDQSLIEAMGGVFVPPAHSRLLRKRLKLREPVHDRRRYHHRGQRRGSWGSLPLPMRVGAGVVLVILGALPELANQPGHSPDNRNR